MALYIGALSGTSLDAIDVALVDFIGDETPQLIDALNTNLPTNICSEFRALISDSKHVSAAELLARIGTLDQQLGSLFADAVSQLLERQRISKADIRAIGSHGLTLWHEPEGSHPFSWQIGDPNIIAAQSGITTVSDFRRRDVAEGGQGAPLATALHLAYLHSPDENRAVVNIGGMANISKIPANSSTAALGYDTGPGNNLMDTTARRFLGSNYDKDGALGASGEINDVLLQQLLKDEYFVRPAPKSSGPEYFNAAWLSTYSTTLECKITPADLQATLVELTAKTIAAEIDPQTKRLMVCGGGARNLFLMRRLQQNLPNCPVTTTSEYGLEADWVEAILFAWLAKQRLNMRPGNAPDVTGAKRPAILGGVYAP